MQEEAGTTKTDRRPWMTPGVGGIGTASFLADVGHEVPTSLMASFVTATLGAPAAALGLIEGISEGLAGAGRFVGGALADDPKRRRAVAVERPLIRLPMIDPYTLLRRVGRRGSTGGSRIGPC